MLTLLLYNWTEEMWNHLETVKIYNEIVNEKNREHLLDGSIGAGGCRESLGKSLYEGSLRRTWPTLPV